MVDLLPITIADQIAEVEREIAQRRQVYPRLVNAGKLTQARADRHIKVMEKVRETLKGLDNA